MVKLTYLEVKKIFEKEGYSLVSKEYVDSTAKLETVCPKGHTYKVTIRAFRHAKSRCPICSGKTPHNTSSVKILLKNLGYTLITENYINMHQKLETICPNGHNWNFSLDNFLSNGSRCPTCK